MSVIGSSRENLKQQTESVSEERLTSGGEPHAHSRALREKPSAKWVCGGGSHGSSKFSFFMRGGADSGRNISQVLSLWSGE